MLLEVNRARHLIVGRPPAELADAAIWRELGRFRIIIFAEPEHRDLWKSLASEVENLSVLDYDASLPYELASNIRRALDELGAEPFNSIYVTFRPRDELQEAVNTRLGTIQVGGAIGEVMADVFLKSFPGELAKVTNGAELRRLGYLAETLAVVADGLAPCAGGQIITQANFFRLQPHIDNVDELAGMELILLGRYFPSGDARHGKHQLSRRLLKAKDLDPRGAVIARAVGGALHTLATRDPTIDLITRVPPKPSKDRDHLAWLLDLACRRADLKFADDPSLLDRLDLDVLRCIRDYPSQKSAGAFEDRAANVRGAFESNAALKGKHIVLVDDVLTSGSTIAESARQLVRQGAAKVTVLVIASNQNSINAFPTDPPCPSAGCDGTMHVIFKNSDPHTLFWGCSNFRTNGCRGSMAYSRGLSITNQSNTRDDLPSDFRIDF